MPHYTSWHLALRKTRCVLLCRQTGRWTKIKTAGVTRMRAANFTVSSRPPALSPPSFTKVIQIRPPVFRWTASVCVFGHHKAISGSYSCPHFCLMSRCDCVRLVLGELLKVTEGSRSQRDFKVEWRRFERVSTSRSPEPLLQQSACLQVIASVISLSRDLFFFLINIPNCSPCLSFFFIFSRLSVDHDPYSILTWLFCTGW